VGLRRRSRAGRGRLATGADAARPRAGSLSTGGVSWLDGGAGDATTAWAAGGA
jgi:hypothetical protein